MSQMIHSDVHAPKLSSDRNIYDYGSVVWKYKKMIAVIVMLVSVFAVITSLYATKFYQAYALIVPVSSQSSSGLAGLAAQFGGLASMTGARFPTGVTDDALKMLTILKSRTLAENVINRENLMPILFENLWDPATESWKIDDPAKKPNMEAAVQKMRLAVKVTDDKKNKTIKIIGVFKDPQLAARVVNAYLDELQYFISTNALTVAKRNRIFIEGQLEENKRDFLESGKEINEFYTANKISNVEAMLDVHLDDNASSPVSGGDLYALNDHPVLANAASQVSAPALNNLLTQKSDIEQKIMDARVVRKVPQQVYFNYLMLRRQLLTQVNALLATQYEMAKIEESKEDLSFQIIDEAVPPVRRCKPKRAQTCIMSFFMALFFAVFLAFFRDYLQRIKAAHSGR